MGTYLINGNQLTISPTNGSNEEWAKTGKTSNGNSDVTNRSINDTWGKKLKNSSRKLEKYTYTFSIGDLMFKSCKDEYGYDVWVYEKYGIGNKMYTIVKCPGSILGAQTMLFYVLEANATIIILSNTGTVNLDGLAS